MNGSGKIKLQKGKKSKQLIGNLWEKGKKDNKTKSQKTEFI